MTVKTQASEGLWRAVLGEIELSVSRANYETWFKNTQLVSQDSGQLVVAAPNVFAKRQLEDKFDPLITKTLKKHGVEVNDVEYKVKLSSRPQATPVPSLDPISAPAPAVKSGLNGRYTFDNFVVGASNELAYATAQAIAREPGTKYNPFFLYGGVGLGKTHLIQAIGSEIVKRNQGVRVEYVTLERFKNEFIASILRNNQAFTNKYRDVDVLIVDDMQFIAGKEKTQVEFFHTFNALHQKNKQIIISSDRPPKDMSALEDRLRNRFEWGMSVDIQAPDFETRVAIVAAKAARHGVRIRPDVAEFLATAIEANIRELEGALTKVLAHCEMRSCEPTLEIVQHMIKPSTVVRPHLSPKQVVEKTARFFNVQIEELIGPRRDKEVVEPRQIAMYLMRTELHLSFPQISRHAGRNDHSTAIHSVGKIEKAINTNHYLRQKVFDLKEKLYA